MTTTLSATQSRFTADAVRLDGVRKAFGPAGRAVLALDGVDLSVAPGEFVCLLGASGCGKSTLLNLVAGLDRPTAGKITLNTSRPAVMFQEAALMPWLTAARNVELPLRLAGFGRAERRGKAGELLRVYRSTGTSVLFVTHDVREAIRLGQRVVLLSSRPGRVVREWTDVQVADSETLTEEITGHLREVISTHAAA